MQPKLYRRRYIPNEVIELKDDKILRLDEELLLTKWETLKPRADISHGVSCVYFNKNVKVSKIFDANNRLVYYYCDIVMAEFNKEENALTVSDLLADVIVMPDGFVKVVDIAELSEALDEGLIDTAVMKTALRTLDWLLEIIYAGNFSDLTKLLDAEGHM